MNKKTVFKRLAALLAPYSPLILLSLLLSAGSVYFSLTVPVLIGQAVDAAVGPGKVDFAAIRALTGRIAFSAAACGLLQWLTSLLNNRVSYRVVSDVRVRSFAHLQTLPLSCLDGISAGELLSRLITDVDQFSNGLLMGFSQLFTGVLTILGTLFFFLKGSPVIALCVVFLTPLSLFVASFIAKHSYRFFKEQASARGELSALTEELMSGGKTVRALDACALTEEKYGELNRRLELAGRRAVFYSSLTNPCTRFVNNLVYALVGTVSALFCIRGSLSVGAMSCFLTYANRYTKPFNEISGVITELTNALSCITRVFELLDQPSESADPPEAVSLPAPEGRVELSGLFFSYVKERPLIENVNLLAEPGRRIAIVGPTGCGKTTLINLLMRFYEPDAGEIRVDGVPVTQMSRRGLRACYGMVLQDTWLKSGTVRENIAYGCPDASDSDVRAAAIAAHADFFIRRLPQGYETPIGEGGCELSAGQCQLLCIARVMLFDPPILILDEATSSLDTLTELRVQRAFETMMEGRTCFIVAHRLSTIRSADLILVMRDGRVVEQGTHEALLEAGGFYKELCESQLTPEDGD